MAATGLEETLLSLVMTDAGLRSSKYEEGCIKPDIIIVSEERPDFTFRENQPDVD